MRHIWKRDEGWATCQRCSIRVKEYRIKLGGISPCHEIVKEHKKIEELNEVGEDHLVTCGNCGQRVPDTIICVYCAVQRHPLGWVKSG